MEAVGNAKANKIWEFTVGAHYPKPNPKSSKDMRERWIWAKYHQKIFVNPVVPPDSEKVPRTAIFITYVFKLMYNAAKKNDVVTILSLLAQGVDIDCHNKADKSMTPLHAAVQESKLGVHFL